MNKYVEVILDSGLLYASYAPHKKKKHFQFFIKSFIQLRYPTSVTIFVKKS